MLFLRFMLLVLSFSCCISCSIVSYLQCICKRLRYHTFEPLDVNFKRSFQCLTRKSYVNIYSYLMCTFKTFFQIQIAVVEYFICVKYVVEILGYGLV